MSRISGVDFERRYRFCNHASRRGHAAFTDSDAWTNQRASTYPGAIFQCDGKHPEPEELVRPVVISGAKIGALRKTGIRANPDLNKVVDPNVLSNPAVLAYGKKPRIFHAYAGLEDHAAFQLRAEAAKNESSNRGKRQQLTTYDWRPCEEPQRPHGPASAG